MLGGVLGGWEIDIVQYCTCTVPSFDSTDAYLSLCVFVKNFVQYLYFVVIFSAMFVCVFFLIFSFMEIIIQVYSYFVDYFEMLLIAE